MARQRKSSSRAKVGPTPEQQEQIFRAATAGMSITQDASQAVGKFLTAAITALQTNMQKILQSNDGTNPFSKFMQTMTDQMITQLNQRVPSAAANNPGQAGATDARSGGPTATERPPGAKTTPRGAAQPKARRPRPRRSKRRQSS